MIEWSQVLSCISTITHSRWLHVIILMKSKTNISELNNLNTFKLIEDPLLSTKWYRWAYKTVADLWILDRDFFLWPLLWRWWGHHGQGKKDGIILIQGMWWYQKRTTTCKILFYPPKKYHHMPWITFFHPLPCWWPLITFISGLVPHTNSGSMGTGTFWRRARLNRKEEEDLWQRTRKDSAARYTTVRG